MQQPTCAGVERNYHDCWDERVRDPDFEEYAILAVYLLVKLLDLVRKGLIFLWIGGRHPQEAELSESAIYAQ